MIDKGQAEWVFDKGKRHQPMDTCFYFDRITKKADLRVSFSVNRKAKNLSAKQATHTIAIDIEPVKRSHAPRSAHLVQTLISRD